MMARARGIPRAGPCRARGPGPGPDRRAPGARGTGAARQRGVRMLSYVLFARGCRLRGRGILFLSGSLYQSWGDGRESRIPGIAPSPDHFEGSKPTGRFGLAVLRT